MKKFYVGLIMTLTNTIKHNQGGLNHTKYSIIRERGEIAHSNTQDHDITNIIKHKQGGLNHTEYSIIRKRREIAHSNTQDLLHIHVTMRVFF